MIISNEAIQVPDMLINPVLFDGAPISCEVRRLDLLHPVVSGNKLFKLKYYLINAIENKSKGLLSFGGPFSNHLVATAFAAGSLGLKSMGFVRGEKPRQFSETLENCRIYGMDLNFLPRTEYDKWTFQTSMDYWQDQNPGWEIIPQGGFGELGVKGAMEILGEDDLQKYSHVICACGTGTMITGLARSVRGLVDVIGISVVKGENEIEKRISILSPSADRVEGITIFYNFHFGGYARQSPELIRFMNHFYHETGIPTDFVYTGKLMYAVSELIRSHYFPAGSRVLVIHSGGLQGNQSLKKGSLEF